MISINTPPFAEITEACTVGPMKWIVPAAMPIAAVMVANNNKAETVVTVENVNSREQNEHEKGDRERQGQRSSYSRSRERGGGRKRQGIESREEEVMATAAPGDREIENGAAGGVVHHASANNAAEEVKVNPVEAKKEEVEKVMLGLPRFRVLAEAVMPRDNRSSRGSRDRSDVSRSDSRVYLLCLVIQKFLL